MNNNCFVIMPYGHKKDVDGNEIDFDEIYEFVIRKAVAEVPGLNCVRCDDIELPGWVHERMVRHIFEDRVAIVDTSTLNANVFYELGVRHALKRCVTVLIHRKGTSWPFNIEGLNSIEYTTNPKGVEDAKKKISEVIANALNDAKNVDSLVYNILPDLRVQVGPTPQPKPLSKVETFRCSLVNCPSKYIALITGDREAITYGEIWVNSENTEMQMDRYYGTSTSASIRYLGAKKDPTTGRVVEDTIADELAAKMGEAKQVDPGVVISTGAGELRNNNGVQCIFHVAAVIGEPREGYHPIQNIQRCVTNALRRADSKEFQQQNLRSILFPIFGTGPGGGDLREHAQRCFNAAIDYLESNASSIELVYFYVWSDQALEICQDVLRNIAQQGRVGPIQSWRMQVRRDFDVE